MATFASSEELRETEARLKREYADLHDHSKDAVDLLFDEAKGLYNLARDRFKTLDGKAATLIGIVTTGFGAIAILGDPSKVPSHGIWLYTALAAFITSFIAALWALRPQGTDTPDPSYYLSTDLVASKDSMVRIKFDLSIAWMRDTASIEHATEQKAARLLAALALLFVGIVSLGINYLSASPAEKPIPSVRVFLSSPKP